MIGWEIRVTDWIRFFDCVTCCFKMPAMLFQNGQNGSHFVSNFMSTFTDTFRYSVESIIREQVFYVDSLYMASFIC